MRVEPGRRTRVVGALVLVAVFVAGVAVGLAVDRLARPQPRSKAVYGADMWGVLTMLGLSTSQRAQAESIIQHRAPATETMMLDVGERLRVISDSLDNALRSILTARQRARLDSLRVDRKIMLKRKVVRAGGTTVVDTVFPRQDSARR